MTQLLQMPSRLPCLLSVVLVAVFAATPSAQESPSLPERARDYHSYDYLRMSSADGRFNMATMFHLRALRRQAWQSDTRENYQSRAGFTRPAGNLEFRFQIRFDTIYNRYSRVTLGLAQGQRLQIKPVRPGVSYNLMHGSDNAIALSLLPGQGMVNILRANKPQEDINIPSLNAVKEDGQEPAFVEVALWRIDGMVEVWVDQQRLGTWPDPDPEASVIPYLEFTSIKATFRNVAITGYLENAPDAAWFQRMDEEHLIWRLTDVAFTHILNRGVRSHQPSMDRLEALCDWILTTLSQHDHPCPQVLSRISVAYVLCNRNDDARRVAEQARQALAAGHRVYYDNLEQRRESIETLLDTLENNDFKLDMGQAEVARIEERHWDDEQRFMRHRTTFYTDNNPLQLHEEFHRDGSIKRVGFRQGRWPVGPRWDYHHNGELEMYTFILVDAPAGPTQHFYPSGNLRSSGIMNAYHRHFGHRFGEWTEYYDQAEPARRLHGHYVNGRRDGIWEAYYATETVAIRAHYKAGRLLDDPEYFDHEGFALSPLVLTTTPELDEFQGEDLGSHSDNIGVDDF